MTAQQAAFGANTTHIGTPQALYTETAPILSCCFGEVSSFGLVCYNQSEVLNRSSPAFCVDLMQTTQMLFTAGCDKQVKVYDVLSGRTTGQVIGQVCHASS